MQDKNNILKFLFFLLFVKPFIFWVLGINARGTDNTPAKLFTKKIRDKIENLGGYIQCYRKIYRRFPLDKIMQGHVFDLL